MRQRMKAADAELKKITAKNLIGRIFEKFSMTETLKNEYIPKK